MFILWNELIFKLLKTRIFVLLSLAEELSPFPILIQAYLMLVGFQQSFVHSTFFKALQDLLRWKSLEKKQDTVSAFQNSLILQALHMYVCVHIAYLEKLSEKNIYSEYFCPQCFYLFFYLWLCLKEWKQISKPKMRWSIVMLDNSFFIQLRVWGFELIMIYQSQFPHICFIPEIVTFISLSMMSQRLVCLSGACRECIYTRSSHKMGKARQLSEWLCHFGRIPYISLELNATTISLSYTKLLSPITFQMDFPTSAHLFIERMSHWALAI